MKVALYMTTILEQFGGFEKSFIEIALGLNEIEGIEVEMVTMSDSKTTWINKGLSIYFRKNLSKVTIYRESSESIRSKLKDIKYTKCSSISDLRKKLNEFDVIYSKNELIEGFVFKYLIKYKLVPPVIYLCGTALFYPDAKSLQAKLHNYFYLGPVYSLLMSNSIGFHTKNMFDVGLLKRKFKNHGIFAIPNPFNFNEMDELEKYHTFVPELNGSKFNILWAARLTEQKGIGDLVQIIERVNKNPEGARVVWNIAGEGEDKDSIQALANTNNNVHCLGHVEASLMPSLYSQSDLFITTSKWESFGNTVVEAQYYDLPVISFDIIGPNEIIIPGKTGLLVKTVDEFADAIISVIKNQNDFSDIKKSVIDRYETHSVSLKLFEILSLVPDNKAVILR